jgi:hypothetical protein
VAKEAPKVISDSQAVDEVQRLAGRLFEQHWQPGALVSGKDPSAFAAMCFQGAQVFLRVAGRIREGQKPEEIISPPVLPDNVTITPSL